MCIFRTHTCSVRFMGESHQNNDLPSMCNNRMHGNAIFLKYCVCYSLLSNLRDVSLVEVTELYSKRVLGGQIVFMIIVNRFPNFLYLFKTTYALKFAIRVHCPWQYVADLCNWSLLCNCTLQWKAFITTWYHVT